MGEQAVTGAGATPAPEQMPDAGGDDAAALLRASPDLPALTVLPEVYAHRVRHLPPDHDGSRTLVPAVRQALAILTD